MTALGRDQGPGLVPRSRIQPRLVRVNKSQQRAVFGLRGLWGWAACARGDGVMKMGDLGS